MMSLVGCVQSTSYEIYSRAQEEDRDHGWDDIGVPLRMARLGRGGRLGVGSPSKAGAFDGGCEGHVWSPGHLVTFHP